MTADIETLLTLQEFVVQALRLADSAGLHDIGISLDAARLKIAVQLRAAGCDADVVKVPAPGDLLR